MESLYDLSQTAAPLIIFTQLNILIQTPPHENLIYCLC